MSTNRTALEPHDGIGSTKGGSVETSFVEVTDDLLKELLLTMSHLGNVITLLYAQERLPDWYRTCKVGVVLSDLADRERQRAEEKTAPQCHDETSLSRDDHLAPGETEYYTQSGIPHGTFTCANCGLIARWQLSPSERMEASRELA